MSRMTYADALKRMETEPGRSVMVCLDDTGDTKIVWDREKPTEIAIARAAWDKAKRDGYMAYKVVGKDGAKGEIMHEFDPLAERVILAPALRGGTA